MMQLKIVLCPVDFSNLAQRELQLAVEVCEAFGAHLVLHHNLAAVSPGFTRAWEWKEVHRADQTSPAEAERRLRSVLAEVPKTVSAEASLSSGPVATVLLQLAEKLPADLLVLGSHGWSTEDHASVTERIIDRSPCPVLTVQDFKERPAPFRLRAAEGEEPIRVVVPTDLSDSAGNAVTYAFELAGTLPLELHLVHVLAGPTDAVTSDTVRRRLRELAPAELVGRVSCHVETGHAIDEILAFAQRNDPGFILMGEHARGFFRRFLTRDTAREVLHRARWPVWFVPPVPRAHS